MSEQNTPFEMTDPTLEKDKETTTAAEASPAPVTASPVVSAQPAPTAPHSPAKPHVDAGATARASSPMSKVAAPAKHGMATAAAHVPPQAQPAKRDTVGETFKHIKEAGSKGLTVSDLVASTKRDQREVQSDVNHLKGKGSIAALSERRPHGENMESVYVASTGGEEAPAAPLPVHKQA